MQIICDGLDLCDAVITVSRAINTKVTNPILEGIKLSAEEDTLTLSATDLEFSIEKKIKADVKIEGQVVVPGRFFGELIKKLTNEKIELKLTENNLLKVKYCDSETTVQCFNVYDFPDFKKLETNDFFAIDKKTLKNVINKTSFAVAVDDTRPVLKGVLFEIEQGNLKAVALDGYRLALYSTKIRSENISTSVIVPARSLLEIAKLIDDTEELVNVYFQKNFMMVDLDGCIITTRLLDGDFVNYKQIINISNETVITVNKKQLEDALERASLLSKVGQNNLVQFEIRDQNLCITSRSEIGNINENIGIVFKGKEITIAFNARFFLEALRSNNDEYININFKEPQNPCTITSINENSDYVYLILPVRLLKN